MKKIWSFSSLQKSGKKCFWTVGMVKENDFPDLIF